MSPLQKLIVVTTLLLASIGHGQTDISRFFGINVGKQTNQPATKIISVNSVAKVETVATNLTLTIGGRLWTNATLRVLNSTNASISSGTTAMRINLADLPEPYRSKFYDPKREQTVREQNERAGQERARVVAERELKIAAARQRVVEAVAGEKAERNRPVFSNDSIEITEVRATGVSDDIKITGKLLNKTRKELKSVIVVFALYDVTEEKVGDASAQVTALAPGESWKFEATGSAKNADAYRVEKISCSEGRLD
jgi:hypothetical protein